jgi:hypothetical protein
LVLAEEKKTPMRVVLKPAGLLMVFGIFAIFVSVLVIRAQGAKLREAPEMAPIAAFQSKKKVAGGNATFDSRDKMVPVNLTEVGKKDWVVWGLDDSSKSVRKADSEKIISDYTLVQPKSAILEIGKRGPTRGLRWSNGAPKKQTDVTYAGVHVNNQNGFRVKVPASTEEQVLWVYVGGLKTGSSFTATIPDGSKPKISIAEDLALGEGYYSRAYKVAFKATKSGQDLTVTWQSGGGNISLLAAALE